MEGVTAYIKSMPKNQFHELIHALAPDQNFKVFPKTLSQQQRTALRNTLTQTGIPQHLLQTDEALDVAVDQIMARAITLK